MRRMVSKPKIVVVMGPVGSRRSNFINKFMGIEAAEAMRGLGLRTQDIGEVPVRLPNNREYVFVDTPGFDNPDRPARDTLNTIANWLERKYRGGALLTGVVYTHRITSPRMDGLLRESLEIFCCICVAKAAGRVRLVTTMWGRVKDPRAAETMVSQLAENFWKPLLNAGARHRHSRGFGGGRTTPFTPARTGGRNKELIRDVCWSCVLPAIAEASPGRTGNTRAIFGSFQNAESSETEEAARGRVQAY